MVKQTTEVLQSDIAETKLAIRVVEGVLTVI